jgi:hypothetical protein
MNARFLNKLVDAGFGLRFTKSSVVVTSATNDTSTGITKVPRVTIEMPKTLKIRYYPNQNKTTYEFAPKNPPRVKINNINQLFDTLPEYQDYLWERYNESLERIQDQRQEKLDARMDKHKDLVDAQENIEKRMDDRLDRKDRRLNGTKGGKRNEEAEREYETGDQQGTYEVR